MTRAVFFGDTPHRMAGSQRSLLAAVEAASPLGLEPVMVFPAEGAMVEAARARGLPVRVLPGSQAFHTYGKVLLDLGPLARVRVAATELLPYARRLAALLKSERADVVHFNTARGALMAGLGAHMAGLDIVLHVRGAPAIGRTMWAAAQAISSRLVLVARALECHVAPRMRSRTRVIYNGVVVPPALPRADARARAKHLGVPDAWMASDVPVFVALSSLVPFKGLHHLVRAMRQVRDAGVEARLVLAGIGLEDSYEAWLRSLPRELGVADRVRFVGFVENVIPLLVACDALVLPSVETEHLVFDGAHMNVQGNEGLPRSILEAMAAGRAVVATDIAGVREQVEPDASGVVVPPGDVRALADAMIRIARDAEFRGDAGHRALEIVRERFTVEMAGRGLLEVLQEAAQPRPMLARASAAAAVLLERHRAS